MAKRSTSARQQPPATPPGPTPEASLATPPVGDVIEVPVRPAGMADPNVRKPAGVAASAARADALWQQAYPAPDQSGNNETADPPSEVAADNEQEEEEQDQDEQDQQADGHGDGVHQQVPEVGDWEHRYNSMRGRYDQAAEQNRGLIQRLNQLEQHIRTMSPPAPQNGAQPGHNGAQNSAASRLVTSEELSEYGEDFLGVVGRQARDAMSPELAQLKQEVKRLNQQLGNVGTHIQMDARGRMEQELDQTLPAWRDINTDQDFIDWLQLQDSFSGVIRHQLLLRAFEQNQTPRVLAFFQGFLAEATASRPAGNGQAPAAQTPSRVPLQPQMDLSQLAAPGRGRPAAAHQAPTTKPLISRADITAFYNDVRAGKFSVSPERRAEKLQIEQMIVDAQAEGRIV